MCRNECGLGFVLFAAASFVVVALVAAPRAGAVVISFGPSPYLSSADSPFAPSIGSANFHLEDFEDGLLNTPGVVGTGGSVTGPGGITDSVDADDGSIDGSGVNGRSFFGSGTAGITFTFDDLILGALPTAVGIVWTDGATFNFVTFQAFDASNSMIAQITAHDVGDGNFNSGTAEDRFLGVFSADGIKSIFINSPGEPGAGGSGIEVDHLQYGQFVPEPASIGLWMVLSVMTLLHRRAIKRH